MTGKSEGKGIHFLITHSIWLSISSIPPRETTCIGAAKTSLVTYQYPPPLFVPALITFHKPKDWFSKMLTCRAQLAVLLVIQAGVALVTATTCYKYSGQIGNSGTDDSGDTPCDPDAPVSACCGAGSICISNLHCYNVNITTPNVPGTCTDQSFSDPACPCPPSE